MTSGKTSHHGGAWARTALLSVAITLLLMLLGWAVVENQWLQGHHRAAIGYARWGSTLLAVALVLGVLSWRRHHSRAESLRDEVKRLSSELASTRQLFDIVFEAVPSSLLVIDDENRVRMANSAARDVHDLRGQVLEGEHCTIVSAASPERCSVCPGCRTLRTRQTQTAISELTEPRTGAVLAITGHPVSLIDGGDAALLVEDIVTKQKKLQASLLHQEKMAAFGLVAAGVAHEMGNPLSAIEMHLQLLDDTSLSDDDAESVQTLRRETARLRRTLRELVDFARRRRSEATLVSVQSVIHDALRLIRFDRRMRDVKTEVDVDLDTPPVHIVEDHLTQVMVNLIINAIDAMPDGGTLKIDIRHIGKQVAIRVRDNGTGMSKASLERAFEPLYTTKEPGKGTGLGLSICRDVLEAAGGKIELHSAPSKGTTVIVTLPAHTVDEHTSDPVQRRRPLPVLGHTPEPAIAAPCVVPSSVDDQAHATTEA